MQPEKSDFGGKTGFSDAQSTVASRFIASGAGLAKAAAATAATTAATAATAGEATATPTTAG